MPAEVAPATVLSVRDLVVSVATDRGWKRAVAGVSFDIAAGETLGLVGESGCGKSMTCMSLLRLLDPQRTRVSGTINLGEVDILSARTARLDSIRGGEIGIVFQEPMTSLNPAFTIGDQIAEVVRVHRGASRREALAAAREMLGLVGFTDPRRQSAAHPHMLSGGMRQRAMLAIALVCHPKLLVADEPTTALDVTIQAQILDLIDRLQQELGLSVLLVSHDLRVVAERCDRVCVMYAGQVVEAGPVHEVFSQPRHPYTSALSRSLPRLDVSAERLGYIPGSVPDVELTGCQFRPRCAYAIDVCATAPVELTSHDGRLCRCVRADSLELEVTP